MVNERAKKKNPTTNKKSIVKQENNEVKPANPYKP